jgi:hypothetical protein
MKGSIMEQSDLDLLLAVPPYHLQSLVKLRRLPVTSRGQNTGVSGASGASGASATTSPATTTIPEIAQHLFEAAPISEAIRSLNESERLVLRELVACGGRANSRDLALYFSSIGVFTPLKGGELPAGIAEHSASFYPTPHPHGPFEQSLRRLLLLGLVFWGKQTNFAGRDYTSGIYDGVVIVPQAVKDVVNDIVDKERNTKAEQPVTRQEGIGEGIHAFQRMLYLYWSHAASLREGLQLVNSGLLSRTILRQVIEQQGHKENIEQIRTEQDVPRLLFIRLLLMKLDLLQERQGSIHAADAEEFFSLPVLERARRCYHLWLEGSFWNELLYLPEVMVRPGPNMLDPVHEEVIHSRQVLMERVQDEQAGAWLGMSSFIARTKLYAPYLLFPRQYGTRADRYSVGSNPYNWDFRLRRGWLTHREGWHLVEGGFIRAVVLGPLQWMGLVEVKNEGSAVAFCSTPGTLLVTSEAQAVETGVAWGRLIVQPNFELVALAPVSEALLMKLDRFAERIGLEHIAQYRLTKASVTRAIQMGLHAETIQRVLEESAGPGAVIPQNVSYSLVEWERQARRIEVWQGATLLEVDDSALLDELFADEEARELLGRRLSPVLAEVAANRADALQDVFWRRDYLPALTTAPDQDSLLDRGRFVAREPQWRLHDDGLLQPLYAVTDLYLVAEVERISTLDELTGWRKITPSEIERACSRGITLDAIIRFLQHYCEDGVPASFLIRLKLWGGGYGERPAIQVEQAPLLYLSAKILQDLQSDEEVGELLGAEVVQEGRLVRVPAEHLERVIELLRKRGFVVE